MLKKKVCAGYMYESEVDAILKASNYCGQNITETISFFIRWAISHFEYKSKEEFNAALLDELAKAQVNEMAKTPEWKAEIERLGKEKIKELGYELRSGESS
jgi:hypothetical protein